jgi:hypothetical protein
MCGPWLWVAHMDPDHPLPHHLPHDPYDTSNTESTLFEHGNVSNNMYTHNMHDMW